MLFRSIQEFISVTKADQWMPFLSRVNGTISGPQLAKKVKVAEKKEPVDVFLRTQIEVATDRAVTLSANGADKADLWVDSKPVQGDTNFTTHLTAGKHTVVIRLNGKNFLQVFGLCHATSRSLQRQKAACPARCSQHVRSVVFFTAAATSPNGTDSTRMQHLSTTGNRFGTDPVRTICPA